MCWYSAMILLVFPFVEQHSFWTYLRWAFLCYNTATALFTAVVIWLPATNCSNENNRHKFSYAQHFTQSIQWKYTIFFLIIILNLFLMIIWIKTMALRSYVLYINATKKTRIIMNQLIVFISSYLVIWFTNLRFLLALLFHIPSIIDLNGETTVQYCYFYWIIALSAINRCYNTVNCGAIKFICHIYHFFIFRFCSHRLHNFSRWLNDCQ